MSSNEHWRRLELTGNRTHQGTINGFDRNVGRISAKLAVKPFDELKSQSRFRILHVTTQTEIGQCLHEQLILRFTESHLHLPLRLSFQEVRAHQVVQDLTDNRQTLLRSHLS